MAKKQDTLSWQPGSYSLEYIVKNFQHHLPQVIQCDHTGCGSGSSVSEGCGPPLLLHSLTNLPRAVGVSLVEDSGQEKSLKETQDHLVIPFDYKGWFIMSGSKPNNDDVPAFYTVSAVVDNGCDHFLIGGNKKIDILRKTPNADAYAPAVANPGDLLKALAVLEQGNKYLQCMDESNQTILIDYKSKGIFYMVSSKNKRIPVFQIKDIISSHQQKLPCVVKLLLGREPHHGDAFSGWIRLTGIEKVDSVLASTVTIGENGLLEIPRSIRSSLKYRIATLNSGWQEYLGFKEAMRLCRRYSNEYMRSIRSTRVKEITAAMLRGVQSGASGQDLLDRSVSKGNAPAMTRTRHVYPRHVDTIFESEFEDDRGPETVHETREGCEVSQDSSEDRDYVNVQTVSSKHYSTECAVSDQNNESNPKKNVSLINVKDTHSRSKADISRDGSNTYLTVIHVENESMKNSVRYKQYKHLSSVRADNGVIQSSDPAAEPETSIYADQPCIDEAEIVGGSDKGRKTFADPVVTDEDSHDYINVDNMVLDEDQVTAISRRIRSSSSDYVNIPQPRAESYTRGMCRVSIADSGVYSIGGADDFDEFDEP